MDLHSILNQVKKERRAFKNFLNHRDFRMQQEWHLYGRKPVDSIVPVAKRTAKPSKGISVFTLTKRFS